MKRTPGTGKPPSRQMARTTDKDNGDENDNGINWTLRICLKSARNSRGSQQELSHLRTPREERVVGPLAISAVSAAASHWPSGDSSLYLFKFTRKSWIGSTRLGWGEVGGGGRGWGCVPPPTLRGSGCGRASFPLPVDVL